MWFFSGRQDNNFFFIQNQFKITVINRVIFGLFGVPLSQQKFKKTTTPSRADWVGKFVFLVLVPYEEFRLTRNDFYLYNSLVQGLTCVVFNILYFVLALADGLCCVWLVYPI
jgi:hypothetical protein